MSLPRETMLQLMALADGELEGEERERAEKLAASSDEARQVVETLRAPVMSAWLEEAMDGRLAAADGIADAVMAKLGAGAGGGDGGVVRRIDARSRRSRTPLVVGGLAGVLAIAAAMLLYFRGQDADVAPPPGPVAIVQSVAPPVVAPSVQPEPPASSLTAVAQQAANAGLGVEVNEIDSPAHDVTVFEIPAGGVAAAAGTAAPSSVVIMISDEPVKP
jgi:hypothetical protein